MKTLHTSQRSKQLIASPIRKFLPLVRAAEAQGVKIFKLNVGDPDIPAPAEILKGIRSYRARQIPYAPSPGIPTHVAAWVKHYADAGIKISSAQIVPTQGAAEGILMALLAVTDPGDEVIVFEPLYTSYKGFAALTGITLKPVTLHIERGFRLPPPSAVERKISAQTKAIVLINPGNPTGSVWSDRELREILRLARCHNLFVIADETYRGIVFRGPAKSVLRFREARRRAIVVDSVSKRFSAPGLRLGAVVSYHEDVMAAVLKIAMVRLSAPTVGQLSTVKILRHSQAYVRRLGREYRRRSLVVSRALGEIPGLVASTPQGAFYQVVKLPLRDSEAFVKFLLTQFRYRGKTVLVTPMEDFYITPGAGRSEVRIAYVLNVRALREAMAVFVRGVAAYRRQLKGERPTGSGRSR